jgi:hypothetical protein
LRPETQPNGMGSIFAGLAGDGTQRQALVRAAE